MNPSRLHRLIKPVIQQDGPLIGMLNKKYRNHTIHDIEEEEKPFSIVPPGYIPNLSGRKTSWINKNASCQILGPGMILLKNNISVLGQVDIVSTCQYLGVGSGGFYQPRNRYGHKLRLHMMSLGRNWDPATGYEKRDGSEPPPLPLPFVYLANAIVEEAQAHLGELELPLMCPDVCVVNFYTLLDRLGLHQDCDESSDSLTRGLPVISISIGCSAEFWYGQTRDVNKLDKVILKTGDVLVFGGKSRLIFHGVRKILPLPWACPLAHHAIGMRPGRLNLTLRQF